MFQIFYGALTTQDISLDQLTSMLEVSRPLDELDDDTEEYIAIGRWFAKTPFIVAALGVHSDLAQVSEQGKSMREFHREFYENNKVDGEAIEAIAEFMSKEFSKKVGKGESWEYKISAAYGDSLFAAGVHGITFPSVKADGRTFNIAVKKESVDAFMDIDVAGVARMRKVEDEISGGWFLGCENIIDGKFQWKEPPPSAVNGAWEISQLKKLILAKRNQSNQKQNL